MNGLRKTVLNALSAGGWIAIGVAAGLALKAVL